MSIKNSKIFVNSEIGKLKRVIVHKPDLGISRISPKRAEELLFDDIVHLPKMQEEHDIFTDVLKVFVGKNNVFDTEQLLVEALDAKSKYKEEMLTLIIRHQELPKRYYDILNKLSSKKLAEVLISGYYKEKDIYLFDPIPNFIFTRDIAVTVKDHIIITKPSKTARYRENILTRFFIHAHPIFADILKAGKIINLNDVELFPPSASGDAISMEGGDMMMLEDDYLLIGCSERTSEHAIHSLKKVLFEKKVIKYVVQINIPNDRSFMHIDTLFTRINHNHIVAFKPVVVDGLSSNVTIYSHNGTTRQYLTIKDFFHSEINPEMEFILSGNGISPYQEREQWTDGCNLIAIKPGVGITYDRNPYTAIAFENMGYSMIHADDFLKGVKNKKIDIDQLENTIITLPSSELSRARGGSHCMTFPIERF